EYRSVLALMEGQLGRTEIVAIGETGTDAYWDTSYWKEQVDAFSIQIGWAKSTGKPIIIHSRESLDQNIDLVSKHQDGRLKGIFHCFTGTVSQGRAIMELGFLLGIGGVLSYKNSDLKTVLAEIGPDALVLETDAPFLPPVPHRGKRNEPSYLSIINRQLAELFSQTEEDMARITTTNARRLFNFI
ncbi:MAG TPA: TatD family hydrolase, partial [Saprospiraceae bacterium]|nr:TatD family hydrolase [Saprospiraceae bacterium]